MTGTTLNKFLDLYNLALHVVNLHQGLIQMVLKLMHTKQQHVELVQISICMIWCIPVANILLKINCSFSLKICCYHVNFSPFLIDVPVRTVINLWPLKRKRGCLIRS